MKTNAIFAIKALSILGVVLHHIANRRFSPETIATISIFPDLFSWSVLTFIATAGWLHALSENKNEKNLLQFTQHRAKRLLLPFSLLTTFYAVIWQIIQNLELSDTGTRLPSGYIDKLLQTLPYGEYEPVAEQLYFLPLLFVIAVLTQITYLLARINGVAIAAAASYILGIYLTPNAGNTGFGLGMLLFGIYCYAGGFLLHNITESNLKWPIILSTGSFLVIHLGTNGIPKALPIVIIGAIPLLELRRHEILHKIGRASGTIYAYHTPFVLQPLVILSASLPKSVQIPAVLSAALLTIAICTLFHLRLENTRARCILM